MLYGERLPQVALGVELIGVADELLFEGDGHILPRGQGELLELYLLSGETCPGVAFTHACYPFQPLPAHELCPEITVQQVGGCAVAVNAGCVGQVDAYVVEHGGLGHKIHIDVEAGLLLGNGQGALRHLAAVLKEQSLQGGIVVVVLVYDFGRAHDTARQSYNFPAAYSPLASINK